MSRAMSKGTLLPGASSPGCPKCGGPMWDNRTSKRNPKAPDFRCRNRDCGGAIDHRPEDYERFRHALLGRDARIRSVVIIRRPGDVPSRAERAGRPHPGP